MDKDLDRWLAEKVMGYHYDGIGVIYSVAGGGYVDWSPTSNIAQAFEVDQRIFETREWEISIERSPDGSFAVWYRYASIRDAQIDDKLEMAICQAARKAMEGESLDEPGKP